MEPLDSRNWKSARARGLGLLHLAASVLLFVALTVSHGLASPYLLTVQNRVAVSSHGGGHSPEAGPEASGFLSHVRSRTTAQNASPWHRASFPAHRSPWGPYLPSLSVLVEPPRTAGRIAPYTAAGLPGGRLPRAYDPQGPPVA